MRAIVTKMFDGARDGAIYPITFKPGDTVEGDLAVVAVREKWAEAPGLPSPPLPALTPIPEGWADFKAEDMVALARSLGADEAVKTKAPAADFIKAEIDRRATTTKA